MPRPRFDKLSSAKRERILEAAAKAFAAHGYAGASLNKILADAGISKGAAYYYFDDKADLYTTAVLHYSQELLSEVSFDLAQFTLDSFWTQVTALYRQQFALALERPWVFGIVKSGGALSPDMLTTGPLAHMWQQAERLLRQLLRRGQDLGAIRDDLPDELLLTLLLAVDDAYDRWLLKQGAQLSMAELDQAAARISDALRRLLAP